MTNNVSTLDKVRPGESASITSIEGCGALRRRLLDMGLTPSTRLTVRKVAPFGDPMEISLRGFELTLRMEDAKSIRVAL